jgi:U3 small nucleolar RNA-associated protein 5
MIFSDNGEYVLSSGVGERYVAIWRLGGGKTQSSSCILSMEHPAIFVDCKCSGINANNGEIHVLAISEVGICYFWSGNSMDDLRNKKPTKIALSESSLSRTKQDSTIFAAKLQGIDGPNSTHVLLAYGSVVKPSFDKLLVCYGKDINLGVSEDGVLLPTIQPTMAQKGQYAKTKGILLVFINYGGKFKLVCCLFIYEYPNGPTGQTLFRTGDSGRNSLEKWLSAFI